METLEAASEDESGTPAEATSRRSPAFLLTVALAIVLVAALVISVIEWRHYENQASSASSLQSTESSALKAATALALDFGSYNYSNLHGPTAPWTVLENNSTADYKAKYEASVSLLESTVLTYKSSAVATVPVAAVSTVKGSTVTVILELSQTITDTLQKNGPQSQTFLLTMTVIRQRGQWLLSGVTVNI